MNRKLVIIFVSLMALIIGLAGTTVVAAAPPDMVKVIIGFDRQPGGSEESLVRGAGGDIKYTYHIVPAIAATLPQAAVQALQKNPRVTSIDLDLAVQALDAELDNTWGVKHIGAGTVHAAGNTGIGVKVAIVDSGIDYNHPDLATNYAGGWNFVGKNADFMDDNGHGTHVAGTVAALKNGFGVVGAAPDASLYGLKVLDAGGGGSSSDVVAALEWCVRNGIQVANHSYGSAGDPGAVVKAAFDNSYAAGVLHVGSAGNSGMPNGRGDNVGYPARWDSVMAVAATDQSDVRARWSSTGPAVEISAPGVNINSTLPGGGYELASGTSMASPHVAGVAALAIAAGAASPDEVRGILTATAKPLGNASLYGVGLVDAVAAVGAATPPVPPDPAVVVSLATDQSTYVTGEDTVAVLTATVANETGGVITGLDSTAFATALDGETIVVSFAETATAGTYAAEFVISGLADGTYEVAVAVTDSRDLTGSATAGFQIGPAPVGPSTVSVSGINYSTSGGADGKKHMQVAVSLSNNLGNAVAGASVSIVLSHDSGRTWTASGTTGSSGAISFNINNAPAGTYVTTVTSVSANGLAWDGVTPPNSFTK